MSIFDDLYGFKKYFIDLKDILLIFLYLIHAIANILLNLIIIILTELIFIPKSNTLFGFFKMNFLFKYYIHTLIYKPIKHFQGEYSAET